MDQYRLIKDGEIVGYERHRNNEDLKGDVVVIEHKPVGGSWAPITHDNTQTEVYHDNKDMLTGLTDDMDIYVGDIIRGEYATMTKERGEYINAKFEGVIRRIDFRCSLLFFNKRERYGDAVDDPKKITEDSTALELINPHTVELVGNKYEDPELIPENFSWC